MEIIIPFWMFCGLVAAVIASQRGNSWPIGLLLGFALGPLGVAIVAYWRKNPIDNGAMPGDERCKCPKCAEWIMADAVICRFCGYAMPKDQADEVAVSAEKADDSAGEEGFDEAAWKEWVASFPK